MKELNLFEINHIAGGTDYSSYLDVAYDHLSIAVEYIRPKHLTEAQQAGAVLGGLMIAALCAPVPGFLAGSMAVAQISAASHYFNDHYVRKN